MGFVGRRAARARPKTYPDLAEFIGGKEKNKHANLDAFESERPQENGSAPACLRYSTPSIPAKSES